MNIRSAFHELRKAFFSTSGNGSLLCSFSLYKALTIIVFTEAFLFPTRFEAGSYSLGSQILFYVMCALVCIGVAVFLRDNTTLFSRDWYTALILFFMLFGIMLLFLRANASIQDEFSRNMCLYLGLGALALGFMGLHIEFGRMFGHLGSSKTLAFGVLSSCIGSILYLMTTVLSGPVRWLPIALYAALAVSFFYRARNAIGKGRIYDHKFEQDLQVPYRFMFTSLVQGLSFGFLYGIFAFADFVLRPQVEFVGMLGSAILTALILLVARVDFDRAIYRIGFPLIGIAMLGSGLTSDVPVVLLISQVVGFLYLDLVLWALGSYLIKDCNQPATWVAACPSSMLMTGRAIGVIVGGSIAPAMVHTALLIGAFVIVLVALVLANEHNIKTGWGFIRPGDPHSKTGLEKMCMIIAEEFRLTPRESEVLESLVGGCDADEIAERLFISPNTVKSHIQGIYTKLEVHSRKELLRYVEQKRRLLESR